MFDRFTTDTRTVMVFAAQEAAELGDHEVGTDHLLLGMLGNARSPLFAVLTEQGLTLDAAREAVRSNQDAETKGRDRDRYEADREALRSIGIDLDRVREAVDERFGEDLSAGWGRRPLRGRGSGAGRECGPAGHRDRSRHPGGRPERGGQPPTRPDEDWFDDRPGGFGPGGRGRGRRGPRGGGRGGHLSDGAREAVRAAVGSARDHGERVISVQRLLLAVLDIPDPSAAAVIESATTVEDLRAAVLATLPEAPAAR